MSSILKALRKLEEERSRRSNAPPEIATSLLRESTQRKLLPLWFWPVLICGGILAILGVVWMGREMTRERDVLPVSPPPAPAVSAPATPLIVEEIVATQSLPVPSSVPPPKRKLDKTPPPHASSSDQPVQAVEGVASAHTVQPATPLSLSSNAGLAPTALSAPAGHDLVVTAIAWQEDRAARMAVVNNLPVMAGERIGTAVVEEILLQEVIFSAGNEKFSVPLHVE